MSQNGTSPLAVGFLGIGNMGWGMATNVASKIPKASKLIVYDVDTIRLGEFVDQVENTQAAESPKDVAEKSDVIITSLPTGEVVKNVFSNPSTGLLSASNGNRPKLFLECSTISASTSLLVAKLVQDSGLGDFLDTPVSGGPAAARLGTLTFMVGGDKKLVDKAIPFLQWMGLIENIFHCGPLGAGLVTKQLNNYAANVSFVGLCEVMNAGVRYGLDPKVLAGVINVSSGMSWNSLHQNPVKGVDPKSSAARDFKEGFKTELAKGVIDLAVELADEIGAPLVMGQPLQSVYERALKNDKCRGQECRSIYRLFSEDEGKDLLE